MARSPSKKAAKDQKTAKARKPKKTRRQGMLEWAFKRTARYFHENKFIKLSWIVPVFLIVIMAGFFLARSRAQYPMVLTSAKIVNLFQSALPLGMSERVAFWSESLLKNPALLESMAVGSSNYKLNDTAPLFPRHYDCTTYVETVGALSRSSLGEDVAENLIRIRYKDGEVSYGSRNHFPEADWIPNNAAAGILRDITMTIARKSGLMAAFATKDINKMAWFKAQGSESANRVVASAPVASAEPVTVQLPYLPLAHIMQALEQIPNGSILNIVRENRENYPTLISHQGFLIWKGSTAYFRHASRDKEITEIPFTEYIEQMRQMTWKVVGINVNTFKI